MYKKYKRRENVCLKSDPHFPKKVCFILKVCFNKSPLKVLKDAYFMLKVLFVLRYLNFCLDFLGHVGKRLDKKGKVNFKIYDI